MGADHSTGGHSFPDHPQRLLQLLAAWLQCQSLNTCRLCILIALHQVCSRSLTIQHPLRKPNTCNCTNDECVRSVMQRTTAGPFIHPVTEHCNTAIQTHMDGQEFDEGDKIITHD